MTTPDFTVIMSTRDRPQLFEEALVSVLAQKDVELDIVVINDGSDETYIPAYKALESKYPQLRFIYLIKSMTGHGQSYVLNQGAMHAKAPYIAILDDDDTWTDPQHLSRAKQAIEAEGEEIDLYFTLQAAFLNDVLKTEPIWLDRVRDNLIKTPAATEGIYRPSRKDLIAKGAFAQVNTVIARRDFYLGIGGMDENIRYECDRELFLRAVDNTEAVLFADFIVARHNIPDPTKANNLSTAYDHLRKLQFQLNVFTKLSLTANTDDVRSVARLHHGYILKHMCETLVADDQYKTARYIAGQALMAKFSVKWGLYYTWLCVRSLFG